MGGYISFPGGMMASLRGHFRFADDAVMVFKQEADARKVMDVLPKRFGKYGLRLHPEKTRLVRFSRPSRCAPSGDGAARPGSFDLLGFTHYWAKSRRGAWVVMLKTAKKRFGRALTRIAEWCQHHRHLKVRRLR